MSIVLLAFFYSLAPVFAAAVGASIVLIRRPSVSIRSAIQHFAAGVVFSVAAVEILPDIRRRHHPAEIAIGFCAGIVLMLVLRSVTKRWEGGDSREGQPLPLPMLAAIGLDVLIDGFLIGIGLRAGQKQGLLLAIALAAEFLSLGLATALELLEQKLSRCRTTATVLGVCSLVIAGAVGGTTVLANMSPELVQIALSAGMAALLFLVTEELLAEAHEVEETPWITGSFFAGFLVLFILDMMQT